MSGSYILSDYVEVALQQAEYDKLEDNSFAGRIPSSAGVVAFAKTLRECESELRSTLEDWVLVGLKLGHELPDLANINLNRTLRMSPWNPCKRNDFIRRLRRLGFDGPYSGSKHQFLIFG